MTSNNLSTIRSALADNDYVISEATFEGRPVLVGRVSKFRWRWLASKLTTFVVVCEFGKDEISKDKLNNFLSTARHYAIARKGGVPRGLQTGTATIAVVLIHGSSDAATKWASKNHGARYAAMSFPVVVDLTTGQVTHPKRMIVGAIFSKYLKSVADDIIAPAFHKN